MPPVEIITEEEEGEEGEEWNPELRARGTDRLNTIMSIMDSEFCRMDIRLIIAKNTAPPIELSYLFAFITDSVSLTLFRLTLILGVKS